ncbi:MAG: 3-isopropylmalate dehydratase small subunit [Chloroflexi bacterium]|nr:3-isopropylmalate dehydratase small subunit [Chloroflexota bacterium]MDA1217867.1 3-isopropylmalate dehydratase small subunit [Chloroflexota bacterium]PKB56986.1 MAG: 3-isopropylmalate dehydratase small subunit [SAR202 cluster bacterium Casp-Chloro-G3]
MEPFVRLNGVAAPINRVNIDTDQIIPAIHLKRIERTGYGQWLFGSWRFKEDGSPNPDFVLNDPKYQSPSILVAGRNFGCGSSREHAPWALQDFGIRCIIAPSFADIFFSNCFQNGLLPVVLPEEQVQQLMDKLEKDPGTRLTVDLQAQRIWDEDEEVVLIFEVDPFRKECLLNGLDEIGLTMQQEDEISAFEARH